MIITGGKFKGRRLFSPKNQHTRPTSSIVRQALFNICRDKIEDAVFLDLFAGSGIVGLEALSRGAKLVLFVEKHPTTLRKNIELLGVKEQTIVLLDAYNMRSRERFDIIYFDPPYNLYSKDLNPLVIKIIPFLHQEGLFFSQSPYPVEFKGLKKISSKRFGATFLEQHH